jgi:hypothetical protein
LELLSSELETDEALQKLHKKFAELEIPITPKEEFTKKYERYKINRKTLIEN